MKLLITALALVMFGAANAEQSNDTASSARDIVPTIEFYKRQGTSHFDCSFSLTPGKHEFRSTTGCTNDEDYYFLIKDARENYEFKIMNSGSCGQDESWAGYKIRDPAGDGIITLTAVEESYNYTSGTKMKNGLYAMGYHVKKGQLRGKVSCVEVTGPH